MLALLVTSVIISQTVFSLLPLISSFTVRQIHTLVAYAGLLIISVHLGLHWSLIMGVVRARLGITANSKLRTYALRAVAIIIAAYGVRSLFAVNAGSKLSMQVPMDFGDFQVSTPAFLVHHVAIVGLGASIAHYAVQMVQDGRANRPAPYPGRALGDDAAIVDAAAGAVLGFADLNERWPTRSARCSSERWSTR